ncbi:MAG: HAMP domain-containing protein, partial [Verrucomicrobiota bacterium]
MKSTSPKRGIGITIKIVLACSVFSALAVLGAVLTTYYLSIQSSVALAEEKVSGSRTLIKNQVEGLHRSYSETASKLGQSAILESVFKRYSSETELATARTLFLAAFQQSQCQGLTILDAQGNVLISEGSSLGSNDWKGDQYPVKNLINQALTGNTVEGTFWSSPNGPRESIYFYASPLMNTNGAGMIVCEFNSTRLVELMQFEGRPREASLGSTGEAYLLSDKRTALTPTRGGSNSALNSDAVSLSLQRSEGASVYNNYNGEKVVGAYTTVSAPSENWGLVLEQSYSEALGAGSNLIWMSLGVGLIFIIIVSLFSVVWANWFSRPVMSLDEAMRRVSAGDDEARAPVTSGDEIGLLADNFNQLVEERNTARDRITSDTKRLQNNIQELLLVVADASEGKLSVHAKKTEGVLGNVADALNRMFQNVGVLIGESKNA